jgi:acetyltransferase
MKNHMVAAQSQPGFAMDSTRPEISKKRGISPEKGEMLPNRSEIQKVTKSGLRIHLRPMMISDEPLFTSFMTSLSQESLYFKLFRHARLDEEFLHRLATVDPTKQAAVVALIRNEGKEQIVGVGRYYVDEDRRTAEIMLTVRDDHHDQGIGRELISYLTHLAMQQGLIGFTARVLVDNHAMIHLFRTFEGKAFDIKREIDAGVFYLDLGFRKEA